MATHIDLDPKTVATLKARAALAGVVLHTLEDDAGMPLFIATKWSLTKQMGTVDEVEHFLQRIGGDLVRG